MHIIQTREVLCKKLGINQRTLRKKLKEFGIDHRGHLTPLDLELFAKKYGTREDLQRAADRFK